VIFEFRFSLRLSEHCVKSLFRALEEVSRKARRDLKEEVFHLGGRCELCVKSLSLRPKKFHAKLAEIAKKRSFILAAVASFA
jgi:hypothetical protein